MMAKTKMNKTCHCTGRLRMAIWLKCNFTFTIKKILFFFKQSATFPSKIFGTDSTQTQLQNSQWKFNKGSWLWDFNRDPHILHSDKNKEPDALPIKLIFQHYHRRLIAYGPTSHTVPQYQTRRSKTIYTHSPPDLLSGGRRRPISLQMYQFLFI